MLVLGVGAQKAGTTWLFSQLQKDPGFGPLGWKTGSGKKGRKEVHYWDKAYAQDEYQAQNESGVQKWFKAEHPGECGRPSLVEGRDYFRGVERGLRRSPRSRRRPRPRPLVADVTPSYAGLPLFVWQKIESELRNRRIDYRIIYLVRDPVARIVSAQAMNTKNGIGSLSPEALRSAVLERAFSWQCQVRTRYELTLSNLESVFPEDKLFVGFNELLQSAEQHRRLQDFLGFDISYFDRQERIRVSGVRVQLDRQTSTEVVSFYASTYRSMRERYPFLPSLWPGYELLDLASNA